MTSRSISGPSAEAAAAARETGRAGGVSAALFEQEEAIRAGSSFLVGAAIGTGMAAQSAIRGGADFLIALSAGRMRNMGEPSIAAMLPMRESNEFVMSFACAEILPRASVPVYFGASCFDPRLDLDRLLSRVADAGFRGVANFPSAVLIDGEFRAFIEAEDVGFGRELDLLRKARERGLATLAYIHTREEAVAAAQCGVDLINIDLGWNMGGVLGAASGVRIEEAALSVAAIARLVQTTSPRTRCVVEGGPIVSPRQLEELCMVAQVDGYVGGSTIDRVPSESAIEVVTAAFKAIGSLRQRIDGMERRIDRRSFPRCLWGHSPAIEDARALFGKLVTTDHPVLVLGEDGTGRREVARAIHAFSARKGRDVITVNCADPPGERLALDLLGCMAGAHPSVGRTRMGWLELARGSSLILDHVEDMSVAVQRALMQAVEAGQYWRVGGETPLPLDVRIIAIARRPLRDLPPEAMDPRFAEWLGRFSILMPPLRDRADDLPALIDETLGLIEARAGGARKSLEPTAFRALAAYHWPRNLRELHATLERAALACSGDVIGPQHLPPLEAARRPDAPVLAPSGSEKEWILDALKHNRFRRGRTADYLGMSRKTLYNKMRAHGLLKPGGRRSASAGVKDAP
ncbi:phosphoenolpyruvate hydrolase family protein [Alsobacter sp. SYSU M60028]|uniref:Phosphoenolpyruvate hydrolase family protein n=1 Tax=Alsobacter ponti TaxID=2962936 RepID=A0ABT1LDU1_9HYPH|nr:phosphoenolpyruvate hydrolase family protein [Alsobacter ponti]MCP8939670.1 phosphoenolpyruvate hydrolase family protein [Alsobacter ponti]